jgi:hypothetical protein
MSWEKLEGAARHLNDLADGLTAEILGLEQRLRGLHLGVSHWLDHPLDDGSVLGYTKIGRSWRLAVQRDGQIWPLAQTSRGLRLEASLHFAELLEGLAIKTEQVLQGLLSRKDSI